MDDVTFAVAKDLKLDVMRILDKFFYINPGVAEGLLSFTSSCMVPLDQGDIVMGSSHSTTATTRNGFDHHGVSNAFGYCQRILLVINHATRAWWCGNTRLLGQGPTDGLIFQSVHSPGVGT